MKKEYTKQLVPALLVFLFAYAAGSKLAEFSFFSAQLSLYPYIREVAAFVAIAIPAAELGIVLLLFFPETRLPGLYGSLFLLASFTVYLCIMITTQSNLPCSCGGVISKLTWQQHILFNLFFIFLSIMGIRLERSRGKQLQSAREMKSAIQINKTS